MYSSSRCIDASTLSSMLASPFCLPFLSLSTSSLVSNALCMVTSFLVLWFICRSSSLVCFKNGPDYYYFMISLWILSDSKSPQFSRTLLSIQDNLNNAVFWTFSTHPLISKSSRPFIHSLVSVLSTSFRISITLTLLFLISRSLVRFRYLSIFSLLFGVTLWLAGTANSTIVSFLLFVDNH